MKLVVLFSPKRSFIPKLMRNGTPKERFNISRMIKNMEVKISMTFHCIKQAGESIHHIPKKVVQVST